MPVLIRASTISPAIKTPKNIKGNAFLKGTPNKKAAIEPVQAPVKGKGIATKLINAIAPYLFILLLVFLLVLSKTQEKNLAQILLFEESQFETGPKNKSKNTTGIILPKTEKK